MKRFYFPIVAAGIFIVCFTCGFLFYTPPKIAILYIATGRYIVFWPKFYDSMERHFLPGYDKHYYIFTDDKTIEFPPNVTRVERKQHPWPWDTLDRFEMFLGIKEDLKKYDYIYFLNGNAEVVQDVGEEIFPAFWQDVMVAWHPGYYRPRNPLDYPYDRNKNSTAYIPMGEGKYYVQGGFNGGRTRDVLKMYECLYQDVQENIKRGVTARWHDESHLNHYILDKHPLVMSPNYIWAIFDWDIVPEFQDKIKIRMRHKSTAEYGGVDWLRGNSDHKIGDKPSDEELKTAYPINHNTWTDYLILSKNGEYCRFYNNDCADVTKLDNKIQVKWKNWPPEEYIFNPKTRQYDLMQKI